MTGVPGMHPMGYESPQVDARQSQVMCEVERQGLVLAELTEAVTALERRLAPVMLQAENVPSEKLAHAREVIAPLADMIRQGNDTTADCVTRLSTILRCLEV